MANYVRGLDVYLNNHKVDDRSLVRPFVFTENNSRTRSFSRALRNRCGKDERDQETVLCSLGDGSVRMALTLNLEPRIYFFKRWMKRPIILTLECLDDPDINSVFESDTYDEFSSYAFKYRVPTSKTFVEIEMIEPCGKAWNAVYRLL